MAFYGYAFPYSLLDQDFVVPAGTINLVVVIRGGGSAGPDDSWIYPTSYGRAPVEVVEGDVITVTTGSAGTLLSRGLPDGGAPAGVGGSVGGGGSSSFSLNGELLLIAPGLGGGTLRNGAFQDPVADFHIFPFDEPPDSDVPPRLTIAEELGGSPYVLGSRGGPTDGGNSAVVGFVASGAGGGGFGGGASGSIYDEGGELVGYGAESGRTGGIGYLPGDQYGTVLGGAPIGPYDGNGYGELYYEIPDPPVFTPRGWYVGRIDFGGNTSGNE